MDTHVSLRCRSRAIFDALLIVYSADDDSLPTFGLTSERGAYIGAEWRELLESDATEACAAAEHASAADVDADMQVVSGQLGGRCSN